jgi:arsenate reductase
VSADKPKGGSSDETELEQREYSSPACSLREIEQEAAARNRVTIFHNPACTKSRQTLALIREAGIEPRIVEYLRTPPTEAELLAIVQRLRISPLDLIRKNEAVFLENYAGKSLTDMQWIEAMVAHPILIERPIVVRGADAAIGRPPENVKRLLELNGT